MSILKAIEQMSKEEIQEIKDAVAYNKKKIKNGKYDAGALSFMFAKWKKLFPKVKQSMSCKGCRDSVVKFFEKMVEMIDEQEKPVHEDEVGSIEDVLSMNLGGKGQEVGKFDGYDEDEVDYDGTDDDDVDDEGNNDNKI